MVCISDKLSLTTIRFSTGLKKPFALLSIGSRVIGTGEISFNVLKNFSYASMFPSNCVAIVGRGSPSVCETSNTDATLNVGT